MGSGRGGRLFDSFLRIMGALFCIYILIVAIMWLWPYAQTLAWHIEHGGFAYVGDFRVPVATWVRPDPNQHPLAMDLHPKKFSMVDFGLGRKVTPGNKLKQAWDTAAQLPDPCKAAIAKHELGKKSIQLMIADQPSRCIEDILEIRCVPENTDTGLTVRYVGSSDLKPAFYEMLSKITRAPRKQ